MCVCVYLCAHPRYGHEILAGTPPLATLCVLLWKTCVIALFIKMYWHETGDMLRLTSLLTNLIFLPHYQLHPNGYVLYQRCCCTLFKKCVAHETFTSLCLLILVIIFQFQPCWHHRLRLCHTWLLTMCSQTAFISLYQPLGFCATLKHQLALLFSLFLTVL